MHHDVIDNRQEKLLDHIRTILPYCESAKFAVGYFFVSGLEAVADQLDNVQELRLLIGNTSSRETIEQIAEGYRRLDQVRNAAEAQAYPKKSDIEAAVQQTADAIGDVIALMDPTDEAQRLVSTLVRLIEQGRLHVRVYSKGRLHAKAYIFDYGTRYDAGGRPLDPERKGLAIVGSSNFTLAGVISNTELNVRIEGDANHEELTRWFEGLWEESQGFEQHLMRELGSSWALAETTPYEVYLKTVYELVREHLEGDGLETFLWPADITAVLAEFQEEAVRHAAGMIQRYGGCFVADVVGMGKSYIGAALIKQFELHDDARALIICPASLVDMWDHYNEAYRLNARILSMGMLKEDEQQGPEWLVHHDLYRDRDFVLVDESHNFRHRDNQRYRVLESYLSAGDRRCVFLTATPRNKSVWDIYHQLRLFHPQERTELPVDPPNVRQYFKLVEGGERRLPALLSHVLIRRTRHHILRWYGYDEETGQRLDPDNFGPYRQGLKRAYVLVGGRKQFFPKRELQTVEYSIEATYGGLYQRLRGLFGRPHAPGEGPGRRELTYARYGLWNYVRPAKRNAHPYAQLHRAGANLRGLMRIMMFKRLESSVYAFRQTVHRLLGIHQAFVSALDQGIVAAGIDAQKLLYESDRDEEQLLIDALAKVAGQYRIEDFHAEVLRHDLVQDIAVLREMLRLVEPITPEEDDKLQTLRSWLRRSPLDQGKRLIFTQYADTARYLFEHLRPDCAEAEIEVIYSDAKSRAQVVGRFAPKANPEHRPPPGAAEIQTLVATDVLAEGLNLQDCDKVVNYDLHWNPVRLIQRLGRIDRIGSEYDVVHAFNFLPETSLDQNLGLHEKLAQRIREIHETIGEDAAILDPSEQLNEEAMYAIYAKRQVDGYEEDDADQFVDLHEAEEIMRHLREDQPQLYQRITEMRDGLRCGRRCTPEGTVVLCRAGRFRELYLVDQAGEIISRDMPYILGLLKCDPDTASEPLPAGHNQVVNGMRQRFAKQVADRKAEQKHTLSLTLGQRYVLRELGMVYKETDDADVRATAALLEAVFRQSPLRPPVRDALNRLRKANLTGMSLLRELTKLRQAYGLQPAPSPAEVPAEENEELPRIVCSEALLSTDGCGGNE